MTSRERVLMALSHEEPDRVPIQDGPWGSTITRWRKEGLPEDADVVEYFSYEFASIGADTSPRFKHEVLDEDDEYIITRDAFGSVRRNHKDHSTTPEIIDCAVKNREDWERMKERLEPSEDRVDWEQAEETYRKQREKGRFITYNAAVGYDKIQAYVRSDRLLVAIVEEPEWVIDMYETDARLCIDMCEILLQRGFQFDGAFLYCDLGYRNALLFSPKHYREQLHPVFCKLCDYFNSKDMPVLLHSCGRVVEIVHDLIEAGFACLQPLEVKAGMDLIKLKQEFGDRLAFMGGIDVRAMADPNPKRIEEEIRTKFEVAKKGGGYIYHSDHSVPNNVSFQQYCRVMELVRKYGVYR